jgi:hypothetical protein
LIINIIDINSRGVVFLLLVVNDISCSLESRRFWLGRCFLYTLVISRFYLIGTSLILFFVFLGGDSRTEVLDAQDAPKNPKNVVCGTNRYIEDFVRQRWSVG